MSDAPAKPTKTQLKNTLPQTGRLDWIGGSSGNRGAITAMTTGRLEVGSGLNGDYHHSRTRQVTLIQQEHLVVIGGLLGREAVRPEEMRRNLVISGINLGALEGRRFRVGATVLRGTEPCHPCHRIEEILGPGGYNASRGMGGLIAEVVEGGEIHVGDEVIALPID